MNTSRILETAWGYQRLGLFAEARTEIETIHRDDSRWLEAQELLLRLDLDQERVDDAANRAIELLKIGASGRALLLNAAQALHYAGASRKAYEMILSHHTIFFGDGEAAYAVASYAANSGDVDFAIRALLFNYRSGSQYWFNAGLDSDLEPIWIHAAAGNISLDSSLALAHPVMSHVIDMNEGFQDEVSVKFTMKNRVPVLSREYLQIHPENGFYTLARQTPARIRDRYLYWQEDNKAWTLRLARQAIGLAKEIVLDHQLEWALEKARAGHFLGARYHTLFALAHRPAELRRFAQELRPLGMDYFFEEALYGTAMDENFLAKLDRVSVALDAGSFVTASEFLDEIPANLQSLTLCLIQRANVEHQRGNLHFAARLYRKIARRWPQDPVGFSNAIGGLLQTEQWEAARQLMDQAPKSYRMLALSQIQHNQLENREPTVPPARKEMFYGQPEWDERLKIIPDSKQQLTLEEK